MTASQRCRRVRTRPQSRTQISSLAFIVSDLIDKALGRSSRQYVRECLALLSEGQRNGVQAMAFPGRRRPIRKHVTQMASAACTDFLHSDHSVARIANTPNMGFVIGFEETRPTRPGIKLRTRFEEW